MIKGEKMDNHRTVHRMSSVFDIMNCRSILMPNRSSIRVLFEYNSNDGKRDFTILSNDLPEETRELLADMLNNNIPSDRIIYGLESNNLEFDDLKDCMFKSSFNINKPLIIS
jgi:hypothetical protein